MKESVSIIVPCYNECESVRLFYQELVNVLRGMDVEYDILFIDDGSTDDTLLILKDLSQREKGVGYLSFSRNFGKEAAIYAGLVNVKGKYTGIMDADLQDPPSLLPQMLEKLREGTFDCVASRRVSRKGEPKIRSFFARRFYRIINKISDAEIVDGARDFRLMKREMVDAIVAMEEHNRFSKGIFGWIGFRTYWLPYENVERIAGETKWSFWKLFKYAIEGFINFSQAPLEIVSWTGIGMTFVSFMVLIFIVIRRLLFGDPVAGWASLICVIIFVGGLQMFAMGMMGQYISRMYMETKKRPHYIIAETDLVDIQKVR